MKNISIRILLTLILIPLCNVSYAEVLGTIKEAVTPSFLKSERPQKLDVDPLSLYARTVWPEDVTTVGAAVSYLLEPSGYKLALNYPAPSDALRLANGSIPPIAKLHRTMPVVDAIQLLIGLDNYVIVDHRNKLVSFSRSK